MLVKSDLTSKDTSLWSSGICTVLIASIKLSVDCSLCWESLIKGFGMLPIFKAQCSWYLLPITSVADELFI